MGFQIYQAMRIVQAGKKLPEVQLEDFLPKWWPEEPEEADPEAARTLLANKISAAFATLGSGVNPSGSYDSPHASDQTGV